MCKLQLHMHTPAFINKEKLYQLYLNVILKINIKKFSNLILFIYCIYIYKYSISIFSCKHFY